MAIDFPASPSVDDTYTVGNVTYTWDGTKWTAVTGSVVLDKIEEGNTSAEVIDTGSDGRFVVTTEGTEALRVDSSQRVGIGTAVPETKLHVEGTTDAASATLRITATGACSTGIACNSTGTVIGTDTGGILFKTGVTANIPTTTGSERARIDTSGRLLVGTSSAAVSQSSIFQVVGGDTARPLIHRNVNDQYESVFTLSKARGSGAEAVTNNDAIGTIFFKGANGSTLNTAASIGALVDGTVTGGGANDMPGRLVFSTTADGASSPTERMRIGSDGAIGVNQLPNTYGNALITFNGTPSASRAIWISNFNGSSTETHMKFQNGGGASGTITTSGSTVAYNTSSDYRLKENIVLLTGAVDRLNQLQVHRFNFIADPDKTVDGFIAHEAQEVVPECVTGTKDEVDEDGNPVYQGIDQSKLVPLLTAALQEAVAEIESLKARVTALEP